MRSLFLIIALPAIALAHLMAGATPDINVSLQMSADGADWQDIAPGQFATSASEARFRAVIGPAGDVDPHTGAPVTLQLPGGPAQLDVALKASTDLQDWQPVAPGVYPLPQPTFYQVEADFTASEFVLIPAGAFTMGSPDGELGRDGDEVQHEVSLTRSFLMQRFEVTWAQWNEVRNWALTRGYSGLTEGSRGNPGDDRNTDNDPVTKVSWYDALKWLNARSEKDGFNPCYRVGGVVYRTGESVPDCDFLANGYRLPTEAEWEYATRAGTTTAFYNGPITHIGITPVDPNLDLIGWYQGNSSLITHPVGQKQPNAWGLYDLAGNAWELCWDWYGPYDGDAIDPKGAGSGTNRVLRGGSNTALARNCRSADRSSAPPNSRLSYVGFRAVRTVVAED